MDIVETVKSHPVATGAIIVGGGLVLFLLMSGGSGGSSTVVASGPSAAQLAASAQIQSASIQADAQNHAADVSATIAGIAAQVQNHTIDTNASVSLAQIASDQALNIHGLDTQLQALSVQAKNNLDIETVKDTASTQQALYNAQVQMTASNNSAAVQQAQFDMTKQMHLADVGALVAQAAYASNTTIAGYNAATQQTAIAAQRDTTIAATQAQQAEYVAQMNYQGIVNTNQNAYNINNINQRYQQDTVAATLNMQRANLMALLAKGIATPAAIAAIFS